jgi:hypothetical protein
VVNSDGSIARSADPAAQTDSFDGKRSYKLTFTRDISACSWLAVPTPNPDANNPPPTAGLPTDQHTVEVMFLSTPPAQFVVTVLC